jgi:hypothetical protein
MKVGTAASLCVALGALFSLFSCAPRVGLRLAPEASGLEPIVKAELARWQRGARARYELVGTGESPKTGFAAMVDIGGSLADIEGTPVVDSREIPRNLVDLRRWQESDALLAAAAGRNGGLACVPLFWDCLGLTYFDGEAKPAITDEVRVDWRSIETAKGRLSLAGGEPDIRGAIAALAGSRADLAREIQKPRWAPDAFHYLRADFDMRYRPGSSLVFLETYRDMETKNVPGHRNFYPLTAAIGSGYAMAGPWLVLRVSGRADAAKLAAPLIAGLLDADFQKEVGRKSAWMPANFAAIERDAEGRRTRMALGRAAEFRPSNVMGADERAALDAVFIDPKRYESAP